MAQAINGKLIASKIKRQLREKLGKLKFTPKVVSFLIGDDPASLLYTEMKQKKAKDLGIDFQPLKYPSDADFEIVANKIKKLNGDPDILGIMIQLPLPKEFLKDHHKNELLNLIDPKKDIDGLNPTQSNFIPATARGVIRILEYLDLNYERNIFAVVGSEGEVGQAIVFELTNKGAVVIKVDKKLPETNLEDIKNADVVISATGVKNLIKPEDIKEEVVLIDVGLGDFNEECYKKARMYTPKSGGTGPMTVISLTENIIEAAISNKQHRN
ncbi:bifunctional 5,10-methylenetetrahydrofolate dehydrogenase/5,10-methenyltetrahydrofolate cyclohydrolase [Candidatus Daviesbacteria bacterium]|nr:bifunctional 5,10-methylenetetrahydrofolate dehydrogenase/5,10-methenyltetrahydrofolate cyclohydrolase [Candidatus Daviesbacteria bacterium]